MSQVYVHLDTVSNHVLSSLMNVSSQTFVETAMPSHILLLSGRSDLAMYDDYTGFYYIRGEAKVREFLELNERSIRPCNWIDFDSVEFLHQLSPQEIADLLYISHAKTHLHSPFFYKLQNEYIYLRLNQEFTKIYFRKMDYFYTLLAGKLTHEMSEAMTVANRRFFFMKQQFAKRIELDLVKALVPYFRTGMVFSFDTMVVEDETYQVPLYLSEDQYHLLENTLTPDRFIGKLHYHPVEGWSFREEHVVV